MGKTVLVILVVFLLIIGGILLYTYLGGYPLLVVQKLGEKLSTFLGAVMGSLSGFGAAIGDAFRSVPVP